MKVNRLVRWSCYATAIGLILAISLWVIGYHGERQFDFANKSLPSQQVLVQNARALNWAPYDPLMGSMNDIGSKLGFMVCADVPNIAYGLSGYSIRRMMEEDFKVHPESYDTSNGNKPGNPYFHRRARNMMSYFQANDRLKAPTELPEIGDFALYARRPGGPILHVALVIESSADHYRLFESAPSGPFACEVDGASPMAHGWSLEGFGRMYGHPNPPAH
ncbi:MAG: DUF1287 domain-containing protein [Candidatus Zixiibacteriota bacterium]